MYVPGVQYQARKKEKARKKVEQGGHFFGHARKDHDAEVAGFVRNFVQDDGGYHHHFGLAGNEAQREPEQGREGVVNSIAHHQRHDGGLHFALVFAEKAGEKPHQKTGDRQQAVWHPVAVVGQVLGNEVEKNGTAQGAQCQQKAGATDGPEVGVFKKIEDKTRKAGQEKKKKYEYVVGHLF